jgi:uncharacterized FlaG/YvyC family protein
MNIDPLHSLNALPAVEPVRNDDPAISRQVATAVRAINQSELYGEDRQLQFARDPDTKSMVIQVVRASTGEIIDQIPPETVLEAFKNMEQNAG